MAAFLSRHWFLLLLLVSLGVTFAVPGAVRRATDFWDPRPTIAFLLFLMAWTMPTRSVLAEARWPFAACWAMVISYGVVPPVGWVLGLLTPFHDLQIGLAIISSVPCTLASAILWTRLAGGNEATALLTVLGTTFSSWFMTTAWLYFLTGATLPFDTTGMMADLVLILVLPVALGQAIRRIPLAAQIAQRNRVLLGWMAQGIILAVVLKTGVVVGDKLHQEAGLNTAIVFLAGIGLALALHLSALASAFFSSRWLGMDRGRQIAVAFSASQKTLPVGLVLYDQYFRDDYPFAVMPVLAYHVGQLVIDTILAERWNAESHRLPPSGPEQASNV